MNDLEPSNIFTKSNSRDKITIYHGSSEIIKQPEYGKGKPYNDYGLGFYTTQNKELAGEWAVLTAGKDGFINKYQLDTTGLEVLNLDTLDPKYWIAILMSNRRGSYENDEVYKTFDQFIGKYYFDISKYDVIIGWRADDSYFSYIEAFSIGTISLENLQKAMKLGNLGQQTCLKSKKAFTQLHFLSNYPAPSNKFYKSAKTRDNEARRDYRNLIRYTDAKKGTRIEDLI